MAVATVAAASGEDIVLLDLVRTRKPVFQALIDARSRYGGSRPAIVDGDERVLTYDEIVRASLALGHALKKGTKRREAVGIMLPTSAGAVIAFFAVSAFNRVPAMLNFTNGAAGVMSALRTAKVKRIVTARRFVELAKLDALIAELSMVAEIVYLEDVREKLSIFDKAVAGVGQFVPQARRPRGSSHDELARHPVHFGHRRRAERRRPVARKSSDQCRAGARACRVVIPMTSCSIRCRLSIAMD